MRAVTFRVAGERGAVDALAVREIARMVETAPLSGAPAPVDGVIVVRGETVPVIDVRARLGLPTRRATADDWLVVTAAGGRTVALRVDDVEEVADVSDDLVREAVGMVGAAPTVAGVARLEDGLLVVHDAARFLSAAEADVLARALRDRAGA